MNAQCGVSHGTRRSRAAAWRWLRTSISSSTCRSFPLSWRPSVRDHTPVAPATSTHQLSQAHVDDAARFVYLMHGQRRRRRASDHGTGARPTTRAHRRHPRIRRPVRSHAHVPQRRELGRCVYRDSSDGRRCASPRAANDRMSGPRHNEHHALGDRRRMGHRVRRVGEHNLEAPVAAGAHVVRSPGSRANSCSRWRR